MGCGRHCKARSEEPQEARRSSGNFHETNVVSDKLGKGAYASVYAVSKGPGEEAKYAAKVISLRLPSGRASKSKEQMVARELKILQKVTDTGSDLVVKFIESFTEGHFVYVVMEKCDETLISALKSFRDITEEVYKPLVKGMLQGLVVIHNAGVVHRDLKPDNYMCCGQGEHRVVKLCDFGLAKIVTSPHRNDLCGINGTAPFMAPEMVKGLHYNAKVDLWSLGVILYLVLYGVFPYMPQVWTSEEMKLAIRLGTPAPTFVPMIRNAPVPALLGAISLPAAAFAAGLLQRRPRDRAGAEEALKHEWFAARALVPAPSLKSMLESAEFYGAFGQPREKEQEEQPSALDVKVAVLQVQHGHSSPWSRQTSAGSNYSCGPPQVVQEMHSSMSLNDDLK